ncbi:hypothetical protein K458DRAFT_27449 [Lentithecium fluviatile CBS 122367]|uniref:Uncharacterized protein n=1 Tax=Lentithecium fluviatile CBS 122367 TaxID=1168545 RepID=A0A6G1J3M8_9PLEO|nr:hypothetical protein K458DRAFT_27449 [Lentithecium fluviatile CBS 122367]
MRWIEFWNRHKSKEYDETRSMTFFLLHHYYTTHTGRVALYATSLAFSPAFLYVLSLRGDSFSPAFQSSFKLHGTFAR